MSETMKPYQATTVFVPGGMPEFTYVPRTERGLEDMLKAAGDNLCKLVIVTGPTKSGKTVLARRVVPREAVWINAGILTSEDDLWNEIGNQLEAPTLFGEDSGSESRLAVEVRGDGKLGVPLLVEGKAGISSSIAKTRRRSSSWTRSRSPKIAALDALEKSRRPLLIDDFHFLPREVQGVVVRGLKHLIFNGQPVIILTVPHRRFDALRVEREMTGRIEEINIPAWTSDELMQIPYLGLPLLRGETGENVIRYFADEAMGSPHLMQEFWRELCLSHGLKQAAQNLTSLRISNADASLILGRIAAKASKPMFSRLAMGPQQRSRRRQRLLFDGSSADIYGVILRSIAELRPSVQDFSYNDIRDSIQETLDPVETCPRANEIFRVLVHMSRLSANDLTSVPVIDWDSDERKLYVTDPFFAFCLKWGLLAPIAV